MASHKLTDNEIRIRIVPMHLRWPDPSGGIIWRQLHDCVQRLHEFARTFDNDCIQIEQKRELGGDEIKRQRTEVANEALKRLANFRPFDIAEQAATREIETLQKREDLTSHPSGLSSSSRRSGNSAHILGARFGLRPGCGP